MREKGNKGVTTGIANPPFGAGGLQIRRNEERTSEVWETSKKNSFKAEKFCLKRNFLYYCSVI